MPSNTPSLLKQSGIETPLGSMIAIADEQGLYMLQFANGDRLKKDIEKLKKNKNASITPGDNLTIQMIQKELSLYFSSKLKVFKTPLHFLGTDFQKKTWNALLQIPYGQTRSYLEQATSMGKEKAFRAVANANSVNHFAIIIPCHRVINHNGDLGGYATGVERKQWLLDHEKQ